MSEPFNPKESQMHVVAWDKDGPIEVEIIGAQPRKGSTIIKDFVDAEETTGPKANTFAGHRWFT